MLQYNIVVNLWQSWNIQSTSDIDKYLDNFRILFAYHSGKIEDDSVTYHDTREIFENGKVISYTGSPRAIFEQQNQKLCYEVLKDKIAAKEPLRIMQNTEVYQTSVFPFSLANILRRSCFIFSVLRPLESPKYSSSKALQSMLSSACA